MGFECRPSVVNKLKSLARVYSLRSFMASSGLFCVSQKKRNLGSFPSSVYRFKYQRHPFFYRVKEEKVHLVWGPLWLWHMEESLCRSYQCKFVLKLFVNLHAEKYGRNRSAVGATSSCVRSRLLTWCVCIISTTEYIMQTTSKHISATNPISHVNKKCSLSWKTDEVPVVTWYHVTISGIKPTAYYRFWTYARVFMYAEKSKHINFKV